jgi:transcriptional regulator with XRE-family HTH domain
MITRIIARIIANLILLTSVQGGLYNPLKVNAEVQMERIRQLRKERGFSQARLAVMADMDPATLNRLERGTGNPNLKTLERVADALGVEVADFFPKAPDRSSPQPSLNDALEDLRSTTLRFQGYHAIQKALDEYREQWEKRLAEGDFDKAALDEGGRALKAFWPAVTAAADAEMGEGTRWGVQPEEAEAQSVLLPAIQRFQVLCDRVNSTYREKYEPTAAVYAFPQRKAS